MFASSLSYLFTELFVIEGNHLHLNKACQLLQNQSKSMVSTQLQPAMSISETSAEGSNREPKNHQDIPSTPQKPNGSPADEEDEYPSKSRVLVTVFAMMLTSFCVALVQLHSLHLFPHWKLVILTPSHLLHRYRIAPSSQQQYPSSPTTSTPSAMWAGTRRPTS